MLHFTDPTKFEHRLSRLRIRSIINNPFKVFHIRIFEILLIILLLNDHILKVKENILYMVYVVAIYQCSLYNA